MRGNDPHIQTTPCKKSPLNIEHFHRVSEIAYKAASGWKRKGDGEERITIFTLASLAPFSMPSFEFEVTA